MNQQFDKMQELQDLQNLEAKEGLQELKNLGMDVQLQGSELEMLKQEAGSKGIDGQQMDLNRDGKLDQGDRQMLGQLDQSLAGKRLTFNRQTGELFETEGMDGTGAAKKVPLSGVVNPNMLAEDPALAKLTGVREASTPLPPTRPGTLGPAEAKPSAQNPPTDTRPSAQGPQAGTASPRTRPAPGTSETRPAGPRTEQRPNAPMPSRVTDGPAPAPAGPKAAPLQPGPHYLTGVPVKAEGPAGMRDSGTRPEGPRPTPGPARPEVQATRPVESGQVPRLGTVEAPRPGQASTGEGAKLGPRVDGPRPTPGPARPAPLEVAAPRVDARPVAAGAKDQSLRPAPAGAGPKPSPVHTEGPRPHSGTAKGAPVNTPRPAPGPVRPGLVGPTPGPVAGPKPTPGPVTPGPVAGP
ncbi:hypothetical protein DYH09_32885, partial [bacterium CPR1]|nr:hypothetical protein [bacterium CPR1]